MTKFDELQTIEDNGIVCATVYKMTKRGTRLRTLKQCHEFIKANDPNSAITPYFIRTLCNQGKLDFITSGNKILVYLDSLLNVLSITA